MDDSFDASLAFTLAEEGGYSDHPTDARFTTNHGITLARLRRFLRDPALGKDDIRSLPCATVRAVYRAGFLEPDALRRVGGGHRPDGVRSCGQRRGPDRAGRSLQLAVGHRRADIDGAVGPETIERADLADTLTLLDNLLAAMQRTSYRQMAAFGLFGDGWLARLDRRRAKALELMAAEPVSRR